MPDITDVEFLLRTSRDRASVTFMIDYDEVPYGWEIQSRTVPGSGTKPQFEIPNCNTTLLPAYLQENGFELKRAKATVDNANVFRLTFLFDTNAESRVLTGKSTNAHLVFLRFCKEKMYMLECFNNDSRIDCYCRPSQ